MVMVPRENPYERNEQQKGSKIKWFALMLRVLQIENPSATSFQRQRLVLCLEEENQEVKKDDGSMYFDLRWGETTIERCKSSRLFFQ